jgi:very-short-patch-repair endonuclease
MALNRRVITHEELQTWADSHAGYRGVRRLRRALELADGAAQSPMETRLRLLLILNGLPKPSLQVRLHDSAGFFLAQPDLYYPRNRLAIEYDGATHRTSMPADNRRQNRLLEAGYRLLRFTAGDVFNTPLAVVGLVRRVLYSIGSPN